MFIFLALVNSTEEGHICKPLFGCRRMSWVFVKVGDNLSMSAQSCMGLVARTHHHLVMVVVDMGLFLNEKQRSGWRNRELVEAKG